MSSKESLIEEIVELELEMFLSVQSRGHASCQDNPDGFKFYRTAGFSAWPEGVLESYLQDLLQAQKDGKNLVTIKYAVMEGLIPKQADNPLREKIVDIEVGWVKELAHKYPYLHRRARPIEEDSANLTSMKTYLSGELETYSDRTIELYYNHLLTSQSSNENPEEKKLLIMVKGAGYSSLEDAEAKLASKEDEKE